MSKRNPIVRHLLLILVLMALIVGAAQAACASVFRSASLSWKIQDPAHPNVVTFKLNASFRWSYPSFEWTDGSGTHYGPPRVGSMLQLSTSYGGLLHFMPNGPLSSMSLPPAKVTNGYADCDCIIVESVFTYTYPATSATYAPEIWGSARLSFLQNGNADLSFRLRAQIAIDMNAPHDSPLVGMPEFISVPRSQVTSFLMGAYAPQGGELTYSIPPVSDTGLQAAVPYRGTRSNPIPIMSLDPHTGLITWDTRGELGSEVALGRYDMQLRVADAWGNYTFRDFVVDVVSETTGTPPRIAINGSETPLTLSGRSPGSVSFEITGTDADLAYPSGLPQLRFSDPTGSPLAAGVSPLTQTVGWTPTSWGVFTLPYWVIDSTNMVATMPVTVNVTAAPRMTCPFPPYPSNWSSVLEATSAAGGTMDYSAEITDPDSASVKVRWSQDDCDSALKNCSTRPEVVHSITMDSGTGSEPFPEAFSLGAHYLRAYLSDEVGEGVPAASGYSGNSTCSFSVYVRDSKPPVLPTSRTITAEATSASGAAVTYPDATDAVDGSVPLVCKPYESQGPTVPSGSTFPLGSTRLVCTATDQAHNSAAPVIFTVTVRDTTPPTIPAIMATIEATGLLTPVTFPNATDAVDGPVPLTCYKGYPSVMVPSGTAFPVGSSYLWCTGIDHAGNRASRYVTVDVRDTTPPVIPALANIIFEATNSSGAVVPYVVPKATDIVDGAVALVCSPASGSTFGFGTSTVQCIARDRAGNRATASFTVTVRDTTPPVIGPVVPSSLVLWPPNHQIVPVAVNYSVTDNTGATCTLAAMSNEPDNGLGDGDTPVDVRVVSPAKVELRSERAGNGSGRVYALNIRCVDSYGNASTAKASVTVPKSMGAARK